MKKFIIEKNTYIDAYGHESKPYFYIKWQEAKGFFKKLKWVYLKHEESGYGHSYSTKTKFYSQSDAQAVIDNYLSKGIIIPKTIIENI